MEFSKIMFIFVCQLIVIGIIKINIIMKKFNREELENIVKESESYAGVMRALNISGGGNHKTVKKAIEEFGIDTSHFTGQRWNQGKAYSMVLIQDYLDNKVTIKPGRLKDLLVQFGYKDYQCEICGTINWQDEPITLELHHINGDSDDNTLSNLQILCPNCHSQTINYRSRNSKKSLEKRVKKSFAETLSKNKVCKYCGSEFISNTKNQIYCCLECSHKDRSNGLNMKNDFSHTKEEMIQLFREFKTMTAVSLHLNMHRTTLRDKLQRKGWYNEIKQL